MDIESKYFHSIMSYNRKSRDEQLNEILHKLECILKEGYILPYKEIREKYPEIERNNNSRSNGDERISICLHTMKRQAVDREFLDRHKHDLIEYAFDMFALESIAIVLNEEIENKYKMYPRIMYLERQVEGAISLKYMDAISIYVTDEIAEYFINPEKKEWPAFAPGKYNIDFLRRVKELLIKYGYNVPILSVMSGNEFHDEEQDVIQKVKKTGEI